MNRQQQQSETSDNGQLNSNDLPGTIQCLVHLENGLVRILGSVTQKNHIHTIIESFLSCVEAIRYSDKEVLTAIKELEIAAEDIKEASGLQLPTGDVNEMLQGILDETVQENRELKRQLYDYKNQNRKYKWQHRLDVADRMPNSEPNEQPTQGTDGSPGPYSGTEDAKPGAVAQAADHTQSALLVAQPRNAAIDGLAAAVESNVATPDSHSEPYFGLLGHYEDEAEPNNCGERTTALQDLTGYLPISEPTFDDDGAQAKELKARHGTGVGLCEQGSLKQLLCKHPIQVGIGLFQIVAVGLVWKEMSNTLVERNHWINANGLSRLYLLQTLA